MPHRIAIASTDGKVINQHFGHAESFHIIDLYEDSYSFVETRVNTPTCTGQEHPAHAFDRVIRLLSDCEAIFVSRIGLSAASQLNSKGIRVFETPYPVDLVLDKLVADKIF